MERLRERIPDGHVWWRIADPAWRDPLDPGFAERHGSRWSPPGSFAVLYLNQDLSTAHANLSAFIAHWQYSPEDLRDDTRPHLDRLRVAAPTGRVRRALDRWAACRLPPQHRV